MYGGGSRDFSRTSEIKSKVGPPASEDQPSTMKKYILAMLVGLLLLIGGAVALDGSKKGSKRKRRK